MADQAVLEGLVKRAYDTVSKPDAVANGDCGSHHRKITRWH
jgi:hypothetical protein